MGMSIRLDERRYVEELKWLVADFRMWKNPLVPLPYAGPRQPVPGMAYPNRPYSPQYGGPGSRPVPQYQAPGPAQVPSQYRRNVGPVSPRYAQPQQQANPVPQNPVQPAQPYPQPPASQVPNVAGGYGQEQGYSPQQYPPQSDGRNKPGQGRHAR